VTSETVRPQRRDRPPPRRAEVVSVSRLTPRLISVQVSGDELGVFSGAAPTSHLKVFLPADGEPQPVVRTYTPRRWDEAAKTLELQFVLHGEGPASAWAEQAKPGDQLAVRGPGGRFQLDPAVRHWWIAGDESAIPAIATLLEALPAAAAAEVHIEAAGPEDEIPLASPAQAAITWHHRRRPQAWGAELDDAARGASFAAGTHVWVACEAAAMRGIRRYLIGDRQLPAASLVTRGYWRLGAENYPDHDYGDDEAPAR
jgi:NADPH-dependent ferric siderophore reductase